MEKTKPNRKETDELVISRTFEVPVELVWKAWTKPTLFKKWWGPKYYSCHYCEMILCEGGKYLHCIQSPQGEDIWSTGTYLQITPHEKLVFTGNFADENGNVVSGSYYGLEEFPMETIINVSFDATRPGTELTVQHNGLPENVRERARIGWNESFDKLTEKLKKRTQWS